MTHPHDQHARYQFLPDPDRRYSQRRRFGLGRHVNHDPRSRRYAYRAAPITFRPVRHERKVPIFDQGNLGSCTGNAFLGVLGTEPYFSALPPGGLVLGDPLRAIPWNEAGAVSLYSAITAADDFDGTYPPDDTGSDGLSAAKVLTAAAIVPGYQHTFSLTDAMAALQDYPLAVGTFWTEQMFEPDGNGTISIGGTIDGGHEWIVDEYVPAGFPTATGRPAASAMVGGTTSWGTSFGIGGRFYLTATDFGKLLKQDGDVIVLTPPTAPAPTPSAPAAGTAEALAAEIRATLDRWGL